MLFISLGCVVLGKTVPEVLSAARGRRHRVQFFPIRTSRLANNIYLSEIIHRLSVFPTYESQIIFHILICLCWSHSFAPIHQNLKFRTWVQVITVLKMWDISLHSRSLYSIRRRVFNISVWTTFRRAIYSLMWSCLLEGSGHNFQKSINKRGPF